MKQFAVLLVGAVLVVGGNAALAKNNGNHGNKESQGHQSSKKKAHHDSGHQDNGLHLAKGHHKFDSRDREITEHWCTEHRYALPIGFRPADRLEPRFEARLQVGAVLDVDIRGFIHPIPSDLLRHLPPPPVDVSYVAIGGHVGLIDSAHRLHDLLPIPHLP